MQYLVMTFFQEKNAAQITPEQMAQHMDDIHALEDELRAKGQFVLSHGLKPSSTATTVRVRDGKRLITDGPFAETREALGGFWIIDVKTLDEAIDFAARLPPTKGGSTEIRPLAH